VRLLQEALASDLRVAPILYAPERLATTAAGRALRHHLESLAGAEQIDERTLAAISETVTSQGVVAGVEIPAARHVPELGHVLVLDGIADPGNAGTMLRTAQAAGAVAVVATAGTTDVWGPKAVRSGMGAHFHLPIVADVAWSNIGELLGERQLLLASAHDGVPYWEIDWSQPSAMIMGSEAHGTSPAAEGLATIRVTIPMAAEAESLNAAAAAAVLLFAAFRG